MSETYQVQKWSTGKYVDLSVPYLKTAMGMENGIKISELLFCDMYC